MNKDLTTTRSYKELMDNLQEPEEFEKKLLINVFDFNDTTVKEVMTPAKDVITIDINEDLDSVLDKIKKYKFTRIPVTNKKKVIGLLNMKVLVLHF